MCAIGMIGTMLGDDFDEIMMKVEEENKALVKEYPSYMESLDKASRHGVGEVSVVLGNFVVKQRELFTGMLSFLVPKSLKAMIICAPISSFCITPLSIVQEVNEKFGKACQTKALAKAIAKPGEGSKKFFQGRYYQGYYSQAAKRGSRGNFPGRAGTSNQYGGGPYNQYGEGQAGQNKGPRGRGSRRLSKNTQAYYSRRDKWLRGARKQYM